MNDPRIRNVSTGGPPVLIFVHGTGSVVRDVKAPRWWQPSSRFVRQLVETIGMPVCVAKPQRWTGANLESDRRHGGAALLARLRRLDARGINYHLIGHSHGGSVIWHALVASVTGERLSGLRSWTTVGTPFLGFAPDPTAWWRYVALLASAVALYMTSDPAVEAWNERALLIGALRDQGTRAELYAAFTLALFMALALNAIKLFTQVTMHVYGLFRHVAVRRRETRAAAWYGAHWLALWHPRDEAIAGLRASLVEPLNLWPRWAGAASRIKRFVVAFHDRGFARAVDEFVWAVGMSRLQGADMSDQRMVDARHCPRALAPGWQPLPPSIADAMTVTADANAAMTTSAFRERLTSAGDLARADQVFASFGTSISWQELIHTSYFEQFSIVEVIAGHVAECGTAVKNDRIGVGGKVARAPGPDAGPVARSMVLAFPINRAIASLTIALLLCTATLSSYEAAIAPYTDRFLIKQIADETQTPALASVGSRTAFGDILVRLVALRRVTDFRAFLEHIIDKESKLFAFSSLANAFGRDFPDTERFLTPQVLAGMNQYFATFPGALRVEAEKVPPIQLFLASGGGYPFYPVQAELLSGLVDAGRKVPDGLVADLANNVKTQKPSITKADIELKIEFEKTSSPDTDESDIKRKVEDGILREQYSESIAVAAVNLYAIGESATADAMLRQAFEFEDRKLRYCPDRPAYMRRAGFLGSIEAVMKVGLLCGGRNVSNSYLLDASFAAHATGRLEEAAKLFDTARRPERDLKYSPGLWDAILLNIDLDRPDVSLMLISEWLGRVRSEPDDAMHDRVVILLTRLREMANKRPADRERIEEKIKAIPEAIIQSFHNAIDDQFYQGRAAKDDIVLSLASLYVSLGRQVEARSLADRAASDADHKTIPDKPELLDIRKSSRDEEHFKRARSSVRAARLYGIVGEPGLAAKRQSEALSLIDGIWTDDSYEIGCMVYQSTFARNREIARRGLAAAIGQAARERDLPTRSIMFANLAYRAAMENDVRQAFDLVRSAGHPQLSLAIFSLILDRLLQKEDPEIYKRWGFSEGGWHPVPASFLNVQSVPRCGVD